MKTKEWIKQEGRQLFNTKGLRNVTLRDVAAAMGKSYGNITYHYATKADLIRVLFADMLEELDQISGQVQTPQPNILLVTLGAPGHTFDLSLKYLFLFMDHVEIQRNYPEIAEQMFEANRVRKQAFSGLFQLLIQQGYLRPELGDPETLDYLMDQSTAMRIFFFLNLTPEALQSKALKRQYVKSINQVLKPYLTPEGLRVFDTYAQAHH